MNNADDALKRHTQTHEFGGGVCGPERVRVAGAVRHNGELGRWLSVAHSCTQNTHDDTRRRLSNLPVWDLRLSLCFGFPQG